MQKYRSFRLNSIKKDAYKKVRRPHVVPAVSETARYWAVVLSAEQANEILRESIKKCIADIEVATKEDCDAFLERGGGDFILASFMQMFYKDGEPPYVPPERGKYGAFYGALQYFTEIIAARFKKDFVRREVKTRSGKTVGICWEDVKRLRVSLATTKTVLGIAVLRAVEWYGAPQYVYAWIEEMNQRLEKEAPGTTLQCRAPLQRISTYGLMNDKLTAQILQQEVFTKELNGQLTFFWEVDESAKNAKEPVMVAIALQYEGSETKLSRKMTAFDNAVYNAVSTIYYYHKRSNPGKPLFVTPQEVWRTMNGETNNRRTPTQKQVAKVCMSLDKMRFTGAFLDISREMAAHHLVINDERIINGLIETYLLKADKATFITEKGAVLTGYRIDEEPILYTYNAAKKHVLWVPYKLLDTSSKTGNDGETVEIREFLLRQIQLMKNGYRNSARIKYADVYEKTAIPTPEQRIDKDKYTSENAYRTAVKKEAKHDRDKIAAILSVWAKKPENPEEQRYIWGFKPVKEGKQYTGVDIALTKEDAKKLNLPAED